MYIVNALRASPLPIFETMLPLDLDSPMMNRGSCLKERFKGD